MASFAEDEEKNRVYDRQIRLWGADAQQRIMASRVLFVGLGAVSVELCKNLVLAGFSATVSDDAVVEPAALGYNFFVDEGALGANAAEASVAAIRELNPFASVDARKDGLAALGADAAAAAAAVAGHGVVVVERTAAAGADAALTTVNAAARASGAKFVYVKCGGDGALAFFDLGDAHAYVVESGAGAAARTSAPRTTAFCSFEEFASVDWKTVAPPKGSSPPAAYLLDRLDNACAPADGPPRKRQKALADAGLAGALDDGALGRHDAVGAAPIAPVAAVVGGILGAEVVKAVSGKGEPTNNLFCYDAATFAGVVLRCSPRPAPPKAPPAPPASADAIEL